MRNPHLDLPEMTTAMAREALILIGLGIIVAEVIVVMALIHG